jgi:uncharacterized membrane protein
MGYAPARHRLASTGLALVVLGFLAYSLPPYFTGDPGRSRVPATFGLHYPLLVAHVMFATVAIIAAVVQVVPWVRRRHPAAHRRVGNVYLFSAVPAGLCGLVIGAATPFGPILLSSNVTMAPLWLWFTVSGYRAARQKRFAEHRRQMIRSVALTFSIISNRIWTVVLVLSLSPLHDSVFRGDDVVFVWVVAGLSGWLGWTIPLGLAQWWLRRKVVMSPSSISRVAAAEPV